MVIYGCAGGTMRAAARAMNAAGEKVGVLAIKLYRPFPTDQVASHLVRAKSVIVMDRSISLGAPSGPLSEDVKATMKGAGLDRPVMSVVYGIGGRDISTDDGKKLFDLAKEKSSSGAATMMYGVKG